MSYSYSCSVGFSIKAIVHSPLDTDPYISVPIKSKMNFNPKLSWSDGLDPQLMPLSYVNANPVVPINSKLYKNPNLSWSAGIHPMLQTFSRYIPLNINIDLDGRISTLPGRFESPNENLKKMAEVFNETHALDEKGPSPLKQDLTPTLSGHSTIGDQILNKNDKKVGVSHLTVVDSVAIHVLFGTGSN